MTSRQSKQVRQGRCDADKDRDRVKDRDRDSAGFG